MLERNRHRIVRQVLELELASAGSASMVQETLARRFRDGHLPEIEALFNELAGPGEVLRFARLEIDLGRVRGADWLDRFFEALVRQLRKAVGKEPAKEPPAEADWNPPQPSRSDDVFRQFLWFLSRGRLPWWGGRPSGPWTEALGGELGSKQWTAVGDAIHGDLRARRRLIHSVPDRVLASATESLGAVPHTERMLERLAPPGLSEDLRIRWRELFWMLVLEAVLPGRVTAEAGRRLARRLLEERAVWGDAVERAASEPRRRPPGNAGVETEPIPQPWREWLEQAARSRFEDAFRRNQWKDSESGEAHRPPAAVRSRDGDRKAAAVAEIEVTAAPRDGRSRFEPSDPKEGTLDEAVYLEGVGVVILHPFLEELFASLGLLNGRDFRDRAARCRAVHLLGYLAYGVPEVPEYDLLLPKLLCNLPWEEPLLPAALEPEEIAAMDTLLEAVLRHWEALKSGSPEWLRAHFFLRAGKLESVDHGFKLTVERQAQDVLLARLPWGLGLIRLPWMTQFLHVSWTN